MKILRRTDFRDVEASLELLDVSKGSIEEIEDKTFAGMTSLVTLDLVKISDDAFNGLGAVEELFLGL